MQSREASSLLRSTGAPTDSLKREPEYSESNCRGDANEKETLKGHSASVSTVAFSADGRTLASGSWDKTVKLYFAATDEEVARQRTK
jgi:WD40 repeat protein